MRCKANLSFRSGLAHHHRPAGASMQDVHHVVSVRLSLGAAPAHHHVVAAKMTESAEEIAQSVEIVIPSVTEVTVATAAIVVTEIALAARMIVIAT